MKRNFVLLLLVVITCFFSSCNKEDANQLNQLDKKNTQTISPECFFEDGGSDIPLRTANYVCTGYYIKGDEITQLPAIYFDDLDEACKHIQNCISTFPDVTWVVEINGSPWENSCLYAK